MGEGREELASFLPRSLVRTKSPWFCGARIRHMKEQGQAGEAGEREEAR